MTLDKRIKEVIGSSVLAPFFIVEGLNITKQVIDGLSDEKLQNYFGGTHSAKDIRKFFKVMQNQLNGNS